VRPGLWSNSFNTDYEISGTNDETARLLVGELTSIRSAVPLKFKSKYQSVSFELHATLPQEDCIFGICTEAFLPNSRMGDSGSCGIRLSDGALCDNGTGDELIPAVWRPGRIQVTVTKSGDILVIDDADRVDDVGVRSHVVQGIPTNKPLFVAFSASTTSQAITLRML
jgi:hypothetical protein